MTLEDATKQFERDFENVVEWDAGNPDPSKAPNGLPYVVCRVEGASAERWLETARRLIPAGARVLYWRVRPEVITRPPQHIYSRFECGVFP